MNKCQVCGHDEYFDSKFCQECGSKLNSNQFISLNRKIVNNKDLIKDLKPKNNTKSLNLIIKFDRFYLVQLPIFFVLSSLILIVGSLGTMQIDLISTFLHFIALCMFIALSNKILNLLEDYNNKARIFTLIILIVALFLEIITMPRSIAISENIFQLIIALILILITVFQIYILGLNKETINFFHD